ncbi:MAG: hypothetical protein ACRD2W_12085 [Acidimicrobiales bacterium]
MGPAIADEITPLIASLPGCGSVTVFGDDIDGAYGIFVLWDTAEDANTAAGIVRPKLDARFAGHVTSMPEAAASSRSSRGKDARPNGAGSKAARRRQRVPCGM